MKVLKGRKRGFLIYGGRNMDKPFVVFDTGDGYAFETGKTCSYGKLLLAIAYISKGNLRVIYREILEKRYNIWLLDNGERHELADEDRQREISIEDILERYPLPEFLDGRHTAIANTPKDELAAIDKNALECVEAVVHTELAKMCNRMVDDVESCMPACFREKNFVTEVEDLLINNDFQKIDMNKYSKNQLLSVAVQVVAGRMIKVYCIESLMQLITMELLAISDKKVHYRRCPICDRVFERNTGRGKTSKYCNYAYKAGLCSQKGQEKIEASRSMYEKKRIAFRNKIHHFGDSHGGFNKMDWLDEFEIVHEGLVERGVTSEIYDMEANEWYDNKKKELENNV